jgi:hypothetical protein
MTGYVAMTKEEFKKVLGKPEEADVEVYILNGGQQTRAILKAMRTTPDVCTHRENPRHYPAVTIYAGSEMESNDYHTVIYLY